MLIKIQASKQKRRGQELRFLKAPNAMNRGCDVVLVIQIHQVSSNMLENVITEGLMRLVLMIENTVVPFMHTIGNTPWLIRANELPDE